MEPRAPFDEFLRILFDLIRKQIKEQEDRYKEEVDMYSSKVVELMNEIEELKKQLNRR